MLYSHYQEKIFKTAETEGHVSVEAVAGSGKTTTLVELAKRLHGNTLFCAFNKHIATELGWKLPHGTPAKTIHALGFSGLGKHLSGRLRVDSAKYRSLCKDEAVMTFGAHESAGGEDVPFLSTVKDLGNVLSDLTRLAQSNLFDPDDIDAMESLAIHYGIDVVDWQFPLLCQSVARIFERGQEVAIRQNVIDFIDMIWLPSMWNLRLSRHDAVLVDECQDLSPAQLEIVLKSVSSSGRVWAIGDSRQAIYGFAGADCESFPKVKSRLSTIDLPLSVCYRCPKSHLDLARQIVPHIESAPGATDGIIEEIDNPDKLIEKLVANDFVLSRKTAPLVKLCLMAIAERKNTKVLGRDIGAALVSLVEKIANMDGFIYKEWDLYRNRFAQIETERLENDPTADRKLGVLWDKLESIDAVRDAYPEVDSLKGLCNAIASIFSDEKSAITFCTIHRAKGLEGYRVFLIKNSLPMQWADQQPWEYQQELNLKYVGLTRSRHYLGLIYLPNQFC